MFSETSRAVPGHMNANVMNKMMWLVCINLGEKLVKKLKELEEDLNNQECARVGSAHWLPPPTRHSMQDISIAAATNRPSLDHTQSMPNLEVRIVLNIILLATLISLINPKNTYSHSKDILCILSFGSGVYAMCGVKRYASCQD